MSLFNRSRDILPVYSNSPVQSDHLINKAIKKSDKHILISIFCFLTAIASIIFGVLHCHNNSFHYSMNCDKFICTHTSHNNKITTKQQYQRSSIKESEVVRIDKNGIINKNCRNCGYSVLITLEISEDSMNKGNSKVDTLLISPYSMDRRLSRSSNNQLVRYITNKSNKVTITTGESVTLLGLMSIFCGFIIICLLILFGKWPSFFNNKKRQKKAS